MSFVLQTLIYNPVQVALIAFIILLGVVIFEAWKRKSAQPAVTGFLLTLVVLLFLDATLPWFWLWLVAILVTIFALKGKLRSYGLLGLSVISFVLPIPFLYMYCPPSLWLLGPVSDGPIFAPRCINGFTTLNMATVILGFLISIFLLVSAILIYKFDKKDASVDALKS